MEFSGEDLPYWLINMINNRKKIAIYGAGGFGIEVAMLIEQINTITHEWDLIGFFDDGKERNKMINDYPVIGGLESVNQWDSKLYLVFALGHPRIKKAVYEGVKNKNIKYPVLIHPNVIIGKSK